MIARRPARARGFTLVELLVTVAMVSLLGAIALPVGHTIAQGARERELRDALRTIRTAIDEYKQAADSGRIASAAGDSGYPRRLEDLLGMRDLKDPRGGTLRFLRRIPADPLAPAAGARTGGWGLRSYASSHERPMAGKDVYDVYSLAEGRGLNGIAYKDW